MDARPVYDAPEHVLTGDGAWPERLTRHLRGAGFQQRGRQLVGAVEPVTPAGRPQCADMYACTCWADPLS